MAQLWTCRDLTASAVVLTVDSEMKGSANRSGPATSSLGQTALPMIAGACHRSESLGIRVVRLRDWQTVYEVADHGRCWRSEIPKAATSPRTPYPELRLSVAADPVYCLEKCRRQVDSGHGTTSENRVSRRGLPRHGSREREAEDCCG